MIINLAAIGENLSSFIDNHICFVSEQVGKTEARFKKLVSSLLKTEYSCVRAYLAQVTYESSNNFSVALCLVMKHKSNEVLVEKIASAFRSTFSTDEHLDIIFPDSLQETTLRKVCCPFYQTERFPRPDFYLTSSEGYSLEPIRACYKRKRFMGPHPDGYMLCDLEPAISKQGFNQVEEYINQIILTNRHDGYSVFRIDGWPCYVHVAKLTNTIEEDRFSILENEVESIGWGEIYQSSSAIKQI